MGKDIKSEIENMKEGERILFSIGLEIGLGLKTFEDIIKSCENVNEETFGKKNSCSECIYKKSVRYGKD